MKMNNKAFTLVELLAVVVILSLLGLIASTSITKILKDSKEDLYETQILAIKSAAETWGSSNMNKLPNDGECKYLTLKDLKENGTLDSNVIDSRNSKEMPDDLKIKITSRISKFGTLVTEYEIDSKDVAGCGYVYDSSVIDPEPASQICTLVEGESQTIGAKYICELDEKRTFYVLETTEDNVSLLMEQNFTDGDGTNGTIPPTVAWCTDGVEDNRTCKNINTTGKEAPEGKDYIGHITGVFNKEGVTVSFPTKEQIEGAYTGNMPQWMYDYLDGTTHPVPGLDGYWTASPNDAYSYLAWYVISNAYGNDNVVDYGGYYGLRPVITISKSSLN